MLAKWPLRSLYYFSFMGNLISIVERGILSKNETHRRKMSAESFAEESVQDRRRNVNVTLTSHRTVPLHDLVPLYLASKTPALSARRARRDELFLIDISLGALCDPGNEFAFTDGNAASLQTQFFRSLYHLDKIPWDVIKARYWSDLPDGRRRRCAGEEDVQEKKMCRRRRCAEFLVHPSVAPRYFSRLVVASPDAAKTCVSLLRQASNQSISHLRIDVEPGYFFQ